MAATTKTRTDPRVARWSPACRAVAALFGPSVEVVLHDAGRDRVLAIWNPMTKREVGDPSLLGELDRLPPATRITDSPDEQDYPAAATDKSGNVWLAYLEFNIIRATTSCAPT